MNEFKWVAFLFVCFFSQCIYIYILIILTLTSRGGIGKYPLEEYLHFPNLFFDFQSGYLLKGPLLAYSKLFFYFFFLEAQKRWKGALHHIHSQGSNPGESKIISKLFTTGPKALDNIFKTLINHNFSIMSLSISTKL